MAAVNSREWPRTVSIAARLASFAVVCGLLYWGRVVLIPVALAALVSFVLGPFVVRLDRLGLHRVVSVVVVTGVATAAVASVGWIVGGQVAQFGKELPAYEHNIRTKIADLRSMLGGGALESVQTTIKDINKDIQNPSKSSAEPPNASAAPSASPAPSASSAPGASSTSSEEGASRKPVPVEISPSSGLLGEAKLLGPVFDAAATAALIMLLSMFMLVKREDLRNRFVSLTGSPGLASTTKAIAEVGSMISRYLLTQFLVNASVGVAVWLGLYLIGVPYSALWGLAAAVLRYVPYVGPVVAAALPIAVSVVTAPGWEQSLLVVGLFVVIEAFVGYVLEPLAYGHSVGLSSIAVIVAAVFWTWLWGPVGLVLATPLTACLVVLARYFPALSPLYRLLGEQPALAPHESLYQRLLARDEDEAEDILERYRAAHSLTETCDELLLGALLLVKRDCAADAILEEDAAVVVATLRELIDELSLTTGGRPLHPQSNVLLVGLPVRDRFDEIALALLDLLLQDVACELEILEADKLVGERIAYVETKRPSAVCILSLAPGELTATRYVVKRLRARLPRLGLAVARLGADNASERGSQLARAAGVARVASSLGELRDMLMPVVHAVQPPEAPAALEGREAPVPL